MRFPWQKKVSSPRLFAGSAIQMTSPSSYAVLPGLSVAEFYPACVNRLFLPSFFTKKTCSRKCKRRRNFVLTHEIQHGPWEKVSIIPLVSKQSHLSSSPSSDRLDSRILLVDNRSIVKSSYFFQVIFLSELKCLCRRFSGRKLLITRLVKLEDQ